VAAARVAAGAAIGEVGRGEDEESRDRIGVARFARGDGRVVRGLDTPLLVHHRADATRLPRPRVGDTEEVGEERVDIE
jgi:hypothetical protein